MPLTRFKLTAIGDDGITSAKLAHDLDFDGTHIRVPHGTTAERPGTAYAGAIRFNTTDSTLEQYNGTNWVGLASPPLVTSVSPTSTNGDSGTVITITGTNFTAESTVHFINNGGTSYAAGVVTYVSGTSLTATFPQNFTVSDEPLDVKVTTSVGNSILSNAIDLGGVPSWTSPAAGSIATGYKGAAISQTLVATDPEGGDVDYTLTSGSLPSGVTLNTETGVISGTLDTDLRSSATYTANITPNDGAGNNGPTRAFTITQNGDGDDNFEYVTSRLTFDGTNDTGNTTIGASRTGSLTPTKVDNPYAGSFNPYTPKGYWATSHRGTGTYDGLKIASNSNLAIGTSNYTYEFWLKETGDHSASKARYFIMGVSGTTVMELATDQNNDNMRYTTGGSNLLLINNWSSSYQRNEWNHIAIVREGTGLNQLFFYVNGVYKDYSTDSGNHGANVLHIGGLDWAADYCLEGYISNFRLSNTARYTNSGSVGDQVFTPPTSPFTSDSNTRLLTCQSNRFVDEGPNSMAIGHNNNSGQTSIVAHHPFLMTNKYDSTDKGSIFFDGSNDALNYANNSAFQVGTGDFALSFWAYVPWDVTLGSYWTSFMGFGGIGYDQQAVSLYIDAAGNFAMDINQTNGGARVQSGTMNFRGQWNYIELSRSSGTTRAFVNGVSQTNFTSGSATTSYNISGNNSWGLYVGASDAAGNSNFIRMYLSEIRLVKGSAGNTANYTPPTAPLTAITNTSFLMNAGDFVNIDDFSQMSNWRNEGAGCLIDTSDKKYGTGSITLNTTDGSTLTSGRLVSDDYAYTRHFDLTGDWTIEFWIKGPSANHAADGQFRRVLDMGGNNAANSYQILVNTTAAGYSAAAGGVFSWGGSTGSLVGQNTITIESGSGQPDVCDNQWHHVRFVHDRSASKIYEYTDGTLYSTRDTSGAKEWTASSQTGGPPCIGSDSTNAANGRFLGRIDDFRIYNGYAASTGSTYTVPTVELPVW